MNADAFKSAVLNASLFFALVAVIEKIIHGAVPPDLFNAAIMYGAGRYFGYSVAAAKVRV